MPTQIAKLASKTLTEQVADFAKKLPDGEGWTVTEISEKLGVSLPVVRALAPQLGIKREGRWYIVNPKTRAKYAD